MKIVLIILSVIGLLKLLDFLVICIIELYYKIRKIELVTIHRESGIYNPDGFYIVPTFKIHKYSNRIDFVFIWLYFEYYSSYWLEFNVTDDESKCL